MSAPSGRSGSASDREGPGYKTVVDRKDFHLLRPRRFPVHQHHKDIRRSRDKDGTPFFDHASAVHCRRSVDGTRNDGNSALQTGSLCRVCVQAPGLLIGIAGRREEILPDLRRLQHFRVHRILTDIPEHCIIHMRDIGNDFPRQPPGRSHPSD